MNHDSAWLMEIDGTRLLVDPWLEGPAVIGMPWIHTMSLTQPPIPVRSLPPADAVLLSHPYPDHTNAATLKRLPRDLPVYSGRIALALARVQGGPPRTCPLEDRTHGGTSTEVGRVAISLFRGGRFDPTHNVYVLRGLDSGERVFYAVHAMLLGTRQARAVADELDGRLDALVCSFTHLDLPLWLGGTANLGAEVALKLVERLRPRYVLQTHDQEKPDTGLITRVQKVTRPPDVAAAIAARGLESELVESVQGVAWESTPAAA